jgi:putative methionine-R-sulfoxide reductase with GAF domain
VSSVPLASIRRCLQGVIPSPFATCGADGTPNVTYMSIVHYVDAERVALSRQFFRKSAQNLAQNAAAQVMVVDPTSTDQFRLDLRYLHTETEGPLFEAMRLGLEAVSRHDAFRLRGVDIHRVVDCRRVGPDPAAATAMAPVEDPLDALDRFQRRLADAEDYEALTRRALEALEDLLGVRHSILLAADPAGERLLAVAANGYAADAAGAEVAVGDGVIGVAAARRQVVTVPNVARSHTMQRAVLDRTPAGRAGVVRDVPLPRLDRAQSVAAAPLVFHDQLIGVLYLESEQAGRLGADAERLLRVLAAHLAAVLAASERDRTEATPPSPDGPAAEAAPAPPAAPAGPVLEIAYYQADDSVFAGGEYVIKGVPGRILWKLLREYASDGRTEFTNRELRLDERLGLPTGNDNLESRLVALRRRLDAKDWGIGLRRVARGRLALDVRVVPSLAEVPTSGVMRAAHDRA